MLPIHTILHPTDFSERSSHAFRLACALARDYDARLVVVHVLPPPMVIYGDGIVPPMPEDNIEMQTKRLHQLQDPGVLIEHRLEEGDIVTEILSLAREINGDLIVMGTHGWTGLSRLLMGSVAEGVMRRATCPVLTVKTPHPENRHAEEQVSGKTERVPVGQR